MLSSSKLPLLLRKPKPEDKTYLLSVENDPENWVFGERGGFSEDLIQDFLSSNHDLYLHGQLRLMMEIGSTNKLSGMIDLFDLDTQHLRVALGIFMSKEHRSKGFALEAIELVSAYCLEELNLHQVYCTVGVNNKPSVALFEKAGFRSFGLQKDWRKSGASFEDVLLYQKIKQ